MQEKMTPGEFLKKIRKRNRDSQQKVASRMSMGQAIISRYERGYHPITTENIQLCKKGYGLTKDEEQKLRDILVDEVAISIGGDLRNELSLFYNLMQLPKDARQRIIQAATAYDSVKTESKK